jgi:TPR repeat protein
MRSLLYASTFAVQNSNSNSPDHPLLLSVLSSNPVSKIHFHKIAASRGSVAAMNLIAVFPALFYSRDLSDDRPHLDQALHWFIRAQRNGSVDAIQDLQLGFDDLQNAVRYFLKHLDRTKSLFSLVAVGLQLFRSGSLESSLVWLQFGVTSGAIQAARELAKRDSSWTEVRRTAGPWHFSRNDDAVFQSATASQIPRSTFGSASDSL